MVQSLRQAKQANSGILTRLNSHYLAAILGASYHPRVSSHPKSVQI